MKKDRVWLLSLSVSCCISFCAAGQVNSKSASASSSAPVFAVATFKPSNATDSPPIIRPTRDGFRATSVTLKMIIANAYGEDRIFRIDGGPAWADLEKYDFNAKLDESAAVSSNAAINDEHVHLLDLALQALLAERCHLVTHKDHMLAPAYALTVVKNGPRLERAKSSDADLPNGILRLKPGEIEGQGVSMARLAGILQSQFNHTIIDKTGFAGTYNFTLRWETNDDATPPATEFPQQQLPPADDATSLIPSALQQQLGLKLIPAQAPINILVIDHLDRPSAN